MFDTNTLVSIALSMVSNFAQIVDVPGEWVPRHPSELERCIIGGPTSPVDMCLVKRGGASFWITHGAVSAYASPGAFSRVQNPAEIPRFLGTTSLTSNEVVQVAWRALQPLIKNGTPLDEGPPKVRSAGNFHGKDIPFFTVAWPKASPGSDVAAEVEIDGRTGGIVDVHVWGPGFEDRAWERQVEEKVGAPKRLKPPRIPGWFGLPKPATNVVEQALANWKVFCAELGLGDHSAFSLQDVDWEGSYVCPKRHTQEPLAEPPCWVRLKNGERFGWVDGMTIGHYCADSAFSGEANWAYEEWAQFEGEPTLSWETLSRALQEKVIAATHVSRAHFDKAPARTYSPPEGRRGHPLSRVKILWTSPSSYPYSTAPIEELQCLMKAEFDLRSGATKSVEFNLLPFGGPFWDAHLANRSQR